MANADYLDVLIKILITLVLLGVLLLLYRLFQILTEIKKNIKVILRFIVYLDSLIQPLKDSFSKPTTQLAVNTLALIYKLKRGKTK